MKESNSSSTVCATQMETYVYVVWCVKVPHRQELIIKQKQKKDKNHLPIKNLYLNKKKNKKLYKPESFAPWPQIHTHSFQHSVNQLSKKLKMKKQNSLYTFNLCPNQKLNPYEIYIWDDDELDDTWSSIDVRKVVVNGMIVMKSRRSVHGDFSGEALLLALAGFVVLKPVENVLAFDLAVLP